MRCCAIRKLRADLRRTSRLESMDPIRKKNVATPCSSETLCPANLRADRRAIVDLECRSGPRSDDSGVESGDAIEQQQQSHSKTHRHHHGRQWAVAEIARLSANQRR